MNKILLYLFTAIMSINVVGNTFVQQVEEGTTTPETFDFVAQVQQVQQSMLTDTSKPQMEITVDGNTVTVRAYDEGGLHQVPYSFDGGITWQADNTYTATVDKTLPIGSVCVRDAAYNMAYSIMPVSLIVEKEEPQQEEEQPAAKPDKKPQQKVDRTAPRILSLDVTDKTIVVNGKDDTALHVEAYSFDGGKTWQSSNAYTVKKDTVFEVGMICLRDAAGNLTANSQEISVPQRDTVKPTIQSVYTEEKTVTITAADETALHAEAYSFDGGKTWQKENTFTVKENHIFAADEIRVRDAEGNVAELGYELQVPAPDITAPVINITVEENVITVTAEDNDALHAEAYSFDGGASWQEENTYTVKEGREHFAAGQICVRDVSGNIARNTEEVIAPEPDKIPPVIEKIEAADAVVTVTASDNELLHEEAYSFDNGNTWQKENTFAPKKSRTFKVGEICVRDANENIARWEKEVTVTVPDTKAPEFIEIRTKKDTITVLAKDDCGLAEEAYSFDGGKTWQKENTFTVKETHTFEAEEIVIRDIAGNTAKSTEAYTITIDTVAPVITVKVEQETVIVEATDDVELHTFAYSFNGGKDWHAKNSYHPTETTTFKAGDIQVRDAAENVARSEEDITVDVKDVIAPSMGISVEGTVVTVTAEDNVALHAEAYSFNGGETWQKENSFTPVDSYVFKVGEIQVRDAQGNIRKSESRISVFVPDTTNPTMQITVENGTVIVTAQDNRELHEMAYSFTGEDGWQISNRYSPVDSMTFEAGAIWVRDAAGNVAKNDAPVVVDVPDTTAPVMSIVVEDGKLTVTATDKKGSKEGALADEPYSFDGGETWQKGNVFAPEKTVVLGSEKIRVRDAAGNEAYNHGEVTVVVPDRKAPVMSVSVKGDTVTVTASDDIKLAEDAYSFDGGKTWQKKNTYQVTEDTVFAVDDIVVRDAAGNKASNQEDLSVVMPDTTDPVITKIEVNDKVLTVTATDKRGSKEGALAEEAYSFDGGKTWQGENTYTHEGEEPRAFAAGDIVVRDAAGNQTASNWTGKVPSKEKDITAPVIRSVTEENGIITVTAEDETALHELAYNFDRGSADSWKKENTLEVTEDITLHKGEIVVRDAAGNQTAWEKEVVVVLADKTAPVIEEITVKNETVTVKASDKKGDKPGMLAEKAYSFDGGKTWQKNAFFTPEDTYTFKVGEIIVRDAAGNTAKSEKDYEVVVKDQTAPEIVSIEVADEKVIVTATDKKGSKEGALADKPYSFDGGKTWQKENTFAPADTIVFAAGQIKVRDAAGNTAENVSNVTVEVADRELPVMELQVGENSVTVLATDNKPLPNEPYSFDGGISWTSEATYTVQKDTTFAVGRIVVRDAAGNQVSNAEEIALILPDKTAPEILSIVSADGKVVVTASDKKGDAEGVLAQEAYSFNGGKTWQAGNEYILQESYTFKAGEIVIRDAAGNKVSNENEVEVIVKLPDNTAPIMHIEVEDNVLTVTAEDETALAEKAYSFDGGKTWQAEGVYTASEDRTFEPKEIAVRDAAGNMSFNNKKIEIEIPDTEAPVIQKITIAEDTVKVKATDNKELDDEPYSFDGGKTWQSKNTFTVEDNTVFAPGSICVKDAAGNVSKNDTEVVVKLSDKIAPWISEIQIGSGTITVKAMDAVALHETAYSFDGGNTWQASNTFTVSANTVFAVGQIVVRDAAGNTVSNTASQLVTVPQPFKPGSLMLDVSSHQGKIDWNQVKAAGYDYVILRALIFSKQDYSLPADAPDPYFKENLRGAKNAGLKVGAYIYTYAENENEAEYEINVFDRLMKEMEDEGYYLDLPVFIDQEWDGLTKHGHTSAKLTNLLRYQMQELSERGYYPGMYLYTNWATYTVDAAQLQREGYDLWIADYRGSIGYNSGIDVVAWQYSSKESVPGIRGNVDVNYLYKDYSSSITGSNNQGQQDTSEPTYLVYDLNSRQKLYLPMDEIIIGMVNNEVGNTFLTGADRTKLYRAQAIASRSWVLYNLEETGAVPRVGLNFSDSEARCSEVRRAIEPVLNKRLTYNGRTANTVYCASSGPVTNNAWDYWNTGANTPYLQSVESARESVYAKYRKTYQPKVVTKSKDDVEINLRTLGVEVTGSPETWIQIVSRNTETGYVTAVRVCGKDVPIADFYETVYGPYSPNFTYTYANGTFTFTSYGFGHGIGMSQVGAEGYIGMDLWNYDQVLAHYYPGTKLENY